MRGLRWRCASSARRTDSAARGAVAGPPDPKQIDTWLADPRRQHGDRLHRLRRTRARLHDVAAAGRGGRAGHGHEPAQNRAAGHQHHAQSGRHVFERLHRAGRPGDSHGRGRGAAGAAAAGVEETGRAGRSAHGVEGRCLSAARTPAKQLGHLRRTGRRQAVPSGLHRVGAGETGCRLQDGRHGPVRATTCRTKSAASTSTCSTCACRGCCTGAWCARAARARMARARRWSSLDETSIAAYSRRARGAQRRFHRRGGRERVGRRARGASN